MLPLHRFTFADLRIDWRIGSTESFRTIRSRALLQHTSIMMARRGVYKLLCNDWRAKAKDAFLFFSEKKLGKESILRKHGGVRERNVIDASWQSEKLFHHRICSALTHFKVQIWKCLRYEFDFFSLLGLFYLWTNSFSTELFCICVAY